MRNLTSARAAKAAATVLWFGAAAPAPAATATLLAPGPATQSDAAVMSADILPGSALPGARGIGPGSLAFESVLLDCPEGQPCASDGDPCTRDVCHANQCTHPYDAHQQCGPDPDACTVVVCLVFGDCAYATRGCYDANPCTNDACVLPSGCTYTNNSAPCNDGDGCTVNDACAGGACGGTAIAPPPEIGHDRFSTRTTFLWDPAANAVPGTLYDVARGLASDLPPGTGGSETCSASGVTGTSLSVPDLPPISEAFWYLVRARNSCGVGTWGSRSNGFPRSTTACP